MSSPNPGSLNFQPQDAANQDEETRRAVRRRAVLPKLIGGVLVFLLLIGIAGAAIFWQLRMKQVPQPPEMLGHVTAPTFTDENGTSFSLASLDGRIWVADCIFTRCGGQCPVMTVNMKKLQDWLTTREQGNVKLVSITVDPENDTPEVLKRYAQTFKADTEHWHFLTGDRAAIYDYIIKQFKLGASENEGQPVSEMFVHSDKFVLMDRDRNIRGYYSGTDEADMEKLRHDIISISRDGEANTGNSGILPVKLRYSSATPPGNRMSTQVAEARINFAHRSDEVIGHN